MVPHLHHPRLPLGESRVLVPLLLLLLLLLWLLRVEETRQFWMQVQWETRHSQEGSDSARSCRCLKHRHSREQETQKVKMQRVAVAGKEDDDQREHGVDGAGQRVGMPRSVHRARGGVRVLLLVVLERRQEM